MKKHSKRYRSALEQLEAGKTYDLSTALEALFSIEIEYFDEDFKNLMNEVRAKASSLVRNNWNGFVNGTKGMVYAGIKKEETPKTISRFIFFYYLYQRILKTKTLGYLTWHSDYPGLGLLAPLEQKIS